MKNIIKVILIITFLILNSKFLILKAQVGINDNNASPDASAMLDVKSTSKGILIPRMTTTERNNINSAATGLMIYNSTANNFEYYNGTNWVSVGDTLGNHQASQNIELQGNYLSNDGGNEGLTIDNNGTITVTPTNITNRPAIFKSLYSGGGYIEVNNLVGTRALFGPDGNGFTGGSTSDVVVANWSNGGLNFHTTAIKRMSISNTGLIRMDGHFKLVNGSQGAGKVLTSDATGQSTWTAPSEIAAAHDTTQPVPVRYRGYIIYVHPTDNATDLDWATAKTTCTNLTAFGKSDWYLPTRLELDAMHKQSFLISGLSQTEIVKYWSSTAKDATYAYTQRLDYGGPDPDAKTDTSGHNCRCVRKN